MTSLRSPRNQPCRNWVDVELRQTTVLHYVLEGRELQWRVRCDAGHEFTASTHRLNNAERRDQRVRCAECYAATRARLPGAKRPSTCCSHCHETGHNRRNCPTRQRRDSLGCPECSDLPWRRPSNRRRLCACGEPYRPEQYDALSYACSTYAAPEREVIF